MASINCLVTNILILCLTKERNFLGEPFKWLEKYSIHHQREDCHFQKDPVTLIKHDKVNNNNNNKS